MANSLLFVSRPNRTSVSANLGSGSDGSNLTPTVVADAWVLNTSEVINIGEPYHSRNIRADALGGVGGFTHAPVNDSGFLGVDFILDLTTFPPDRVPDIDSIAITVSGVGLSFTGAFHSSGSRLYFRFGAQESDEARNFPLDPVTNPRGWSHVERDDMQLGQSEGGVAVANNAAFSGLCNILSGGVFLSFTDAVKNACGGPLAFQVGFSSFTCGDGGGFGAGTVPSQPSSVAGQLTEVTVEIFYHGAPIDTGGGGGGGGGGGTGGGGDITGKAAIDVTLAHHKQGGFWVGVSHGDGIAVFRAHHADFPLDFHAGVAGGANLRVPRLAVEPYSGLLSVVFRGGTGRKAGDDDGMGGTLTTDDPYHVYRRFSFDDGATWVGDPADIGNQIQPKAEMEGVKHIREVFSHRAGERLEFYNDASDVDADGNPTGKGKILVRIYDIANKLIGVFPQDTNGEPPGIGGLTADDTSFEALYVPDFTTFLSCVFVVGAERRRFASFDDGRTWTET